MTIYQGSIFGFNYNIDLVDDATFEVWLEAKMKRYTIRDSGTGAVVVKAVIKRLLGIETLESQMTNVISKGNQAQTDIADLQARVTALENP